MYQDPYNLLLEHHYVSFHDVSQLLYEIDKQAMTAISYPTWDLKEIQPIKNSIYKIKFRQLRNRSKEIS